MWPRLKEVPKITPLRCGDCRENFGPPADVARYHVLLAVVSYNLVRLANLARPDLNPDEATPKCRSVVATSRNTRGNGRSSLKVAITKGNVDSQIRLGRHAVCAISAASAIPLIFHFPKSSSKSLTHRPRSTRHAHPYGDEQGTFGLLAATEEAFWFVDM